MSNKMLIDASHPEETRVAVVRGNRIEEFDFESQEKKQLRGNIYLAKVTRVEPSLQAAFIDYGGNRHGFLAFSEIHPDYYQIPVADRQALLEAEAEEARASREIEDAEEEAAARVSDVEKADAEERPKRKSRRRNTKKAAVAEEASAEASSEESSQQDGNTQVKGEASDETLSPSIDAEVKQEEETETQVEEAIAAKPKRRSTLRKPKAAKTEPADEAPDTAVDAADSGSKEAGTEATPEADEDDTQDPTTIAAIVETDWISEPLPGEDESETGEDEDDDEEQETKASEAEEETKPKRRRSSRTRRKKSDPDAEEVTAEAAATDETAAEAAPESDLEDAATEDASSSSTSEEEASEDQSQEQAEEKAKPRRRSRRKKAAVSEEEGTDTKNEDRQEEDSSEVDENDDDGVESVGQDDALEEAASPRKVRRHYKIQEVIKRRQILLVQVVKEERGNKGAALTTYLSLAGRYSVLMPNTARGGGISRKITNTADRKRLKAIAAELDVPEGMGVILRTAGAARTKIDIERDFQYLMRLWEQVRNLTLSSSAPCLVYEEGSLIKRSIRDLYHKDTGEIIVSGERGYEEACEFMGMLMPNRVKKVKQYKGSQAIFAKYGVEAQLDNMVAPQVTLKSGGYLVMNQTEALVAVDVNSGRATREHSIENTALQTNLEAAEEVARQLRLRDLAGLIVIDFIDMEERRNNRAVEKKLKDCLKNDRARIQVGRISHFGLLEMSRQRMRASVLESTMDICPHCAGIGYVRSESAIALHVFRALEEHVSRHRKWNATVRTTPEIAAHILNYKRAALLELEQKFGVQLLVLGDLSLQGQQFEIDKGDRAAVSNSQSAIGYDGDSSATENGSTAENEVPEEGRNRRKRNRNRKNRDSETTGTIDAELVSEETHTDTDTIEASDENEGPTRKKRRRGNRGGKRRKSATAEENTDISNEESTDEMADLSAAADSQQVEESDVISDEAITEVDASEPEQKPARRSTRRKKAPINRVVETETSVDTKDAEQPVVTEEPPRPKRRTTRRKPVEETASEMSAAVEGDNEDVKAELPAELKSESKTDAKEKTKRSGWWSRGGGFF